MSRSLSARAGGITMTEGSLYKNIFLFSVPLIFSQLLQVLFNMAAVSYTHLTLPTSDLV